MKKFFIVIISMLLIFFLCSCRANNNHNPDILLEDLDISSEASDIPELTDEDKFDEIVGDNSILDTDESTNIYQDYLLGWVEFSGHVLENSLKEETVETVAQYHNIVLDTELGIHDYTRPLFYWGETLDDFELLGKDAFIALISKDGELYQNMDLQRESDKRYTMTFDTNEGEHIIIQVDYFPDKEAVRLVAENNGEQALLFECVKIDEGYVAQYYYNAVVKASYGVQEKAMCAYKNIIFGTDGSAARFDDVEEPPSIIDGIPGEQEIIDGATHWLTLKNGEFTGELNGVAF